MPLSSTWKKSGLSGAAYCSGNVNTTMCCYLFQVSGRERNCAELQCYYRPRIWLAWSRSGTLISLCLVCWVCGLRLKNISMRNSGLNYCNMFKSFFILIWELFAEDSFSEVGVTNHVNSEKLHILPGFSKLQQWHWKLQIMQIFLSFFLCLRTRTGSGCFFCWLRSFCQTRKRRNWCYQHYSTWSLLWSFAFLFPFLLKSLCTKPCTSCIAALYRMPCCLWGNNVQCEWVLAFRSADSPSAFTRTS